MSDEALYNCRKWLVECVNTHKNCIRLGPPILPMRILELDKDTVKLRELYQGLDAVRGTHVCIVGEVEDLYSC